MKNKLAHKDGGKEGGTGDKSSEFLLAIRCAYDVNSAICALDSRIFNSELRKACECNFCGSYQSNYMCPPHIGTPESCIYETARYDWAIVFKKIYNLEDSYDYEGMMEGLRDFQNVVYGVADFARAFFENPFVLGAGGCLLCEPCAIREGQPCTFPKKAVSSLEAYCIQVSELSRLAGMKYTAGENTVTYFGAVFIMNEDCR